MNSKPILHLNGKNNSKSFPSANNFNKNRYGKWQYTNEFKTKGNNQFRSVPLTIFVFFYFFCISRSCVPTCECLCDNALFQLNHSTRRSLLSHTADITFFFFFFFRFTVSYIYNSLVDSMCMGALLPLQI